MASQSTVISMRLPVAVGDRLKRLATQHGWTASTTSARLVEEGLRRADFPHIDFRDSSVGRQAYVQGSRLAIWQVMTLMRSYKDKIAAVAGHLEWPEWKVEAAVNYAKSFSEEINRSIAEHDAFSFEDLKRTLPNIQKFAVGRPVKGKSAKR